MNIAKIFLRASLLASLLMLPLQVLAHTGLKTSAPADGAALQTAPASIDLEFTAAVRLIKLEVSTGGKALEIAFKPAAESVAKYSIPTPGLSAGTYTVDWAVLGTDGHAVTNSFSFSVAPTIAASQ